ncbi:MAG: RidA family protein [Stellaceae bacterium]
MPASLILVPPTDLERDFAISAPGDRRYRQPASREGRAASGCLTALELIDRDRGSDRLRVCVPSLALDENGKSMPCQTKWENAMSSITRATSPHVTEPQPGTWSNCLVAGGVAYIAGMTARGGDLSDEYTQSKAIFGKIRHLIEAAGGTMADIVTITVFVTDISQREKIWQARRETFTGNFPCSTLVQVAALADPTLKVEINAIAHIGAGQR